MKIDGIQSADCLVIGDLNIDLVLNGLRGLPELDKEILAQNYSVVIGGSGGVFTAVLSRLGVVTSIISKISNDFFGSFLIKELKKNGVDVSKLVIADSGETGITINLSYEKGKSQISSVKLIKSFNKSDIIFDKIENPRHIHFSSYYMMDGLKKDYLEIIKKLKQRNSKLTFSFDTNDDPTDTWGKEIYEIFRVIDILFLNRKEALKISRQPSLDRALARLGSYVENVILKLGKEGYLAKCGSKTYRGYCKNLKNEYFQDSTGAGDNFDAGFIYGFLNGFGIVKSLSIANYVAEKSIEYMGGVGPEEKFNKIKKNFKIF